MMLAALRISREQLGNVSAWFAFKSSVGAPWAKPFYIIFV